MICDDCIGKHVALLAASLLFAAAGGVLAQTAVEKKDMELVGYNDLQARSAYQPVIHQQGGRWIAYIGHHGGTAVNPMTGAQEDNGTSMVDVSDPKNPKYLYHIPGEKGGPESGGAQMVRVCNGKDLPKGDRNKVYMLRSLGNVAQEIWDVTVPEKPVKVTTIIDKLKGTHKNWWECDTGIAYLVSGVPEWRTRRMMPVPEAPGNFCSRGGRFGAHASNENLPPMYAKRIVFISWFNAGVRAVDIRDPFNPREIAYYIPAVTDKTDKRCVKTAEGERCKIAIQTNNVEVDDRGYIYIVDRANTGMHILELTGEARKVSNFI